MLNVPASVVVPASSAKQRPEKQHAHEERAINTDAADLSESSWVGEKQAGGQEHRESSLASCLRLSLNSAALPVNKGSNSTPSVSHTAGNACQGIPECI